MAFNFEKYKTNNPLLQEIEEEVTVSSSGVEMGQNEGAMDTDSYKMASIGGREIKAAAQALMAAGYSKEDIQEFVYHIINAM